MGRYIKGERLVVGKEMQQELLSRARSWRQEPTESERILWSALRGQQLGAKFRRQHPVGPFVADFCCPAHHLIVEVDGPIHEGSVGRDAERDALLAGRGYRVLRVRAEDVITDLPSVLVRIRSCLPAR